MPLVRTALRPRERVGGLTVALLLLTAPLYGEQLPQELPWTISREPRVVVGGVNDLGGASLHRVQGAVRMPGGALAVVDAGLRQVLLYDGEGVLRGRVGREGRGPGEFMAPTLLPASAYDSLLVSDLMNVQVSVIRADGSVEPVARVEYPAIPRTSAGGALVVQSDRELPTRGPPPDPRVVRVERTLALLRGALRTEAEMLEDARGFHALGGRFRAALPLTVGTSVAPAPAGFYVTSGVETEIRHYSEEGRLVRRIELPLEARPLSRGAWEEAKAEWLAETRADRRRELTRALDALPPPDRMPLVSEMVADPEEALWVREFDGDEGPEQRWIVVGRDGAVKGTLRSPNLGRITQVGRDYVVVVSEDDLGVSVVSVHDLRRGR